MEKSPDDFLPMLQEKLAAGAEWLKKNGVPALKDELRTFRALLGSIFDTLVKKGMLREDRYDYDRRPSDSAVPPDTYVPETAEAEVVGSRLNAYRRQLDFLLDGRSFELDALDPATLKNIVSLVAYIDWPHFGGATNSPTTNALSRFVARVSLSRDALSARVLNESQAQIQKLVEDIQRHLKEIETWKRESWKAEVRAKVLPAIETLDAEPVENSTVKLAVVKKAFDTMLPKGRWHPELVQQILEEDCAQDSAALRQKVLSSLELPPPMEVAATDASAERRAELRGAVRDLCQVGTDMAAAEAALIENEHELEKRTLTFFQRLRRLFQKNLGRLDDRFYKITFRDSSDTESTETVDFLRFIAGLREIQGILRKVADGAGAEGHRIELMEEEELLDFLEWLVREIRHTYRRMAALNELFQVRAVHERRGPACSIKLELLRIENSLARADNVRPNAKTGRSSGR